MSDDNSTRAVGECSCLGCSKYQNNNCDSCLLRIKTMNCDPNEWRTEGGGVNTGKASVGNGVDPVRSNIYNGGWLCNYEPTQTENSVLCQRQFFSNNVQPPFNTECAINVENKLKGMTVYANRFCYNGRDNGRYKRGDM